MAKLNFGEAITLQDETGADALTVSSLGAAGALLDTGGAAHNVRAYGARGDGVTDDTAALEAAALAAAGGTLIVPPGIYIADRMRVRSGTRVYGYGATIRLRPQTIDVVHYGGVVEVRGAVASPVTGVQIYGLRVDGNKANITTPNPARRFNIEAFDLEWATGCLFIGCEAVDAPGDGFDLDDSTHNQFIACRSTGAGGSGVHCSHGAYENIIIGHYAEGCGHDNERSGLDQHAASPGGARNTYIGCIAKDNYRNWSIGGSGSVWMLNQSLGSAVQPDILTGALDAQIPYRKWIRGQDGAGNLRTLLGIGDHDGVDQAWLGTAALELVIQAAGMVKLRSVDMGMSLGRTLRGLDNDGTSWRTLIGLVSQGGVTAVNVGSAAKPMRLLATAVHASGLPTSDPKVVGQIWNDGGTLKVSAG